MQNKYFNPKVFVTIVFVTCVSVCASVIAQEPEIVTRVDRDRVYLGESIICEVRMINFDKPEPPSLSELTQFEIESLGQSSRDEQSISVINGRMTRNVTKMTVFRFRLTPRDAGKLTIPALTVSVDGRDLSSREIGIHVVAPPEQDIVLLEVSADRTSVYPTQAFEVTLKVSVKKLPGDLSSRNPLSVQRDDPVQLLSSWLDDEQLPEGLQPEKSWQDLLQPLVSSTREGGFRINNIGSQSVSAFFGGGHTTFLPESQEIKRPDLQGKMAEYVQFKISRRLIPLRIGTYSISPSRIKGVFGTKLTERLQGEEIYAVSNKLNVTCRDVPTAGRPASFCGGIGTFEVAASLTPTEAMVGEPVTLSLNVKGNGTTGDLTPPKIAELSGVADQFRIYDATEETTSNGKTFTWSLRPLQEKTSEFPPIEFAYFDVEAEKYVTLKTDPIPVSISAAKALSKTDIVASRPAQSAVSRGLEVNESGLFANHTSLNQLSNDKFDTTVWLAVWCCLIAGYLAGSFEIRRRRRLYSDPMIIRRRYAQSRATEALQLITAATGDDPNTSTDAISKVITGLISDYLGQPEAGMTSTDAQSALAEAGVSEELQKRTHAFLQSCEATRYGAATADFAELTKQCQILATDLGTELNAKY